MAYIDLTKITDRHAQNIITEDSALGALALSKAEIDTRITCRTKEVAEADIPVDGDGYLQSEMLYMYCEQSFLMHLFKSVAGSYESDDIYGLKVLEAKHEVQLLKDELTEPIITEVEVTEPMNRNCGIPIE